MKDQTTRGAIAPAMPAQPTGVKLPDYLNTTASADFMSRATIGPELRQLMILYGRANDLSRDMCDFYMRKYHDETWELCERLTQNIDAVCSELQNRITDAIADRINISPETINDSYEL